MNFKIPINTIKRLLSPQTPLTARILKGLGAQGFGKVVITFQRFVEVPLLLQMWGAQLYGEWLLLAAIPSYMIVSDGGFTQVAVREMSIRSSTGDREGTLSIFQSIQVLLGLVAIGGMALSLIIVPFLPITKWFAFQEMDARSSAIVIYVFVLYVMIGFFHGLLSGAFWCDGYYPRGMFLSNLMQLMEFIVFAIVVLMGGKPLTGALTLLTIRSLGILIIGVELRRAVPWLTYGFLYVSVKEIKSLAMPAFAILAFPLGNALNIQGLRIIVGAVLGPVAVVSFTALRTLARLVVQAREIINQIMQPEMSAAYGKNDSGLFAHLFMRSCQVSVWMVGSLSILMAFGGNTLLKLWTTNQIGMEWGLYLSLLGAGLINSIWYTATTVLLSINKHTKIAVVYLAVYGTLTFALAYVVVRVFGTTGLAAVLIISEILMSLYAVPAALNVTGTTWTSWLQSIMRPPAFLLKVIKPILYLKAQER